jgi:hypothetical protein
MRVSAVVAMAGFAIRTNFRSAVTRGGLVAVVAIAALGPVGALWSGSGWDLDPELLVYGFIAGSIFVLRSGLEQQRERGLMTFLRQNFASPVEHAAGAVLALLGSWAALTGVLFATALALGGSPGEAIWYAWVCGLGVAVLLPFVLLVETVSELRIPMLLPVLGYLVLAVVLSLWLDPQRMVAILGVAADPDHPASSLRLAVRAAAVLPPGMGLFLAGTWARNRSRRGRDDGVPVRH